MAQGTTYGLNFPFRDSSRGDYLQLTQFEAQEIKAEFVIHCLPLRCQLHLQLKLQVHLK